MPDQKMVTEGVLPEIETLLRESDRGAVIIGHAIVDKCLELMLLHKFNKNTGKAREVVKRFFSGQRPLLQSAWAKAAIALANGWISDSLYTALEQLREIRVAFAHKLAFGAESHARLSEFNAELRRLAEICKPGVAAVDGNAPHFFDLLLDVKEEEISFTLHPIEITAPPSRIVLVFCVNTLVNAINMNMDEKLWTEHYPSREFVIHPTTHDSLGP